MPAARARATASSSTPTTRARGPFCEDIPEEECREAPRNFALNAANGACTKTAEQLASPGVVLPLMLAAVAAPVGLAADALEPVRRCASLLPGLVVCGRMRAFPRRKGFWVAAGLVKAATLVVIAVAAAALEGAVAGVVVVVMLGLVPIDCWARRPRRSPVWIRER